MTFDRWQTIEETEEGNEYLATFPSAFNSGFKENDRVQLRVLLPAENDKPVPIVLILHYWGAPNLRVERSLALELNSRGLGAAIMTLPYHLSRTPAGATSGALAIQADPAKLRNTMHQAVMDVRRSIDFLESRPEVGKLIGIYGTSLGAIVSSLSYAVDSRLENAVFLLGGIDLTTLVWNSSRVTTIKDDLRKMGWTQSSLREALRPVEPSYLLPKVVPGRTLVIRAKFDTVIPSACTDLLIEKLPGAQVLEIDTGHYGGVFIQGRLLKESANFFKAVSEGQIYTPPTRIVSPTVRVGFLATTGQNFNIVAGIDVIKFDPTGRNYATFLLTPRAPVLWLGHQVTNGLNLGFGFSTRNVGFGLFWSTVL